MYRAIHTVYSARNEIVQKRSDIITALREGKNEKAATLQKQIEELKAEILKRFGVIIDY